MSSARNLSMRPLSETDDLFKFTLSGLNVSLANGLRRAIQDYIPTYIFDVEKCTIHINTGRLHNEILKQRLQCIPIHKPVDLGKLLRKEPNYNYFEKYIMELDVQNTTENVMYITTKHFKIKNKETGTYLTESEMVQLFPAHSISNSHIIFARLRPRISDTIPGEQLKLSCEIGIGTADENSAFTAACCSAYGNTIDVAKAEQQWKDLEDRYTQENMPREDIEFRKKNFDILDRQRYFVEDSFDFTVESVGVYKSRDLCRIACALLQTHFEELAKDIESDIARIINSETAMTAFDFILEKGDYTIGKALEYYVYKTGFDVPTDKKVIKFCGFKRNHPHDKHTVLRISFLEPSDFEQYDMEVPQHIQGKMPATKVDMKNYVKMAADSAAKFYEELATKF